MSPKVVNTVVVGVVIVLSLALLANSMTKKLGRDEQMYCTSGALLAQGKMIYRDFTYPAQMPYHPLLYAALYRMLSTTHHLLVGRTVSVICDILVVVCILGIYRRVFGAFRTAGPLLGLAGAVLYVFNPLVDYANGYAWNHDVVILCVVVCFWFFISTDFEKKSKYWRAAVMGGVLTFATCMRITTALVQLVFFAALVSRPGETMKERAATALSFLVAAGIVLIWPVWVIAQAPRAFLLNLFWIPMLYGKWLHEIGLVHSKLGLLLDTVKRPGYLALIVAAIYLCIMILRKRCKLAGADKRNMLLAVLLVVVFFVIALVPPTMWRQYLAMPVPLLVISFAYPLLGLRKLAEGAKGSKHFRIACVLLVLCAVVTVFSLSKDNDIVSYRIPTLVVPEGWVPVRLHEVSEDIAARAKGPQPVLTLGPLFAIEGGGDIYPELSAGSIVYRIADRLSPWNRQTVHAVGARTLAELVQESPPSAVIVGVELDFLEEPLFDAVVKPAPEQWERRMYDSGPIVYFRR